MASTQAPLGGGGTTRIAPLDGLRGVAVAAVVLYHAHEPLLPGGYLGVDLFFVISGFIITRLLVEEHARTGRIDLPAFYRRRARRVLPAFLALLAVWLLVTGIERWAMGIDRGWVDPAAAFFGVMNWLRAIDYSSGATLGHLWSLSVEEQYYLAWPIVLSCAVLPQPSRRRLGIAGYTIMIVCIWRSALVWAGTPPEWTYNATHLRADSLLAGCLLALAPPLADRAKPLIRLWYLPVAGLGAFVLLPLGWRSPLVNGPGFTLVALAFAWVVLTAIACDDLPLSRALRAPPLLWLGRRSYSLYLWHYPLLTLPAWHGYGWTALSLAASLLAADLSYRFVETPFLRGHLRARAEVPL